MHTMDYGFYGDYDHETATWCYVTDVLHDGLIVVKTTDDERLLLKPDDMKVIGSLNERIVEINRISECDSNGVRQTISWQMTVELSDEEEIQTEEWRTFEECYHEALLHLQDQYEEAMNASKKKASICLYRVPTFPSTYVTLEAVYDPAYFAGCGQFTRGFTYPIVQGMLMDENGECCADQITSVEDLNKRDQGVCTWKEVTILSTGTTFCFHDAPDQVYTVNEGDEVA